MGSVLNETGIFPAYHMNKAHWISALLDGSVEKEKLEWLLDLSFDLTNKKLKKAPKLKK
jgi:predicted DNA-binding protein (MmcQ/YjbR family)